MRPRRWSGAVALVAVLSCSHAGGLPTAAHVVQVQPSGAEVPANLLRLSVRLAAPVEGPLLPRLALARTDGTPIEAPFLEQELWSPDGRVLTVLLHPARVKSGTAAREALGPILSTGEDVDLLLDGRPIKHWAVGPADDLGPAVSAWRVSDVRPGSRQPLVVALDASIDGRDTDDLAIVDAGGRRVHGRARLANGEVTWTMTPDAPWRAGAYRLIVRGTLEDPAGNRLGSRFETAFASPPGPAVDAVIDFKVGSAR